MSWRSGELPQLSRELDLYDFAFLRWLGYGPEQAAERLQVSLRSLRRWVQDPGKYLPPAPQLQPEYLDRAGDFSLSA